MRTNKEKMFEDPRLRSKRISNRKKRGTVGSPLGSKREQKKRREEKR